MKQEFLNSYTELRARNGHNTRETIPDYSGENASIREEIVRCLWFGSHFDQEELKTDDGNRIEILSPGWWNVESGPDFIRAELLMEDAGHVIGDVEVHTSSNGWWSHGHHRQCEYNNVVLHVVMWKNNVERKIVKENGQKIPQLTLCNYIDEEIAELTEIVDMEGEKNGNEPTENAAPEKFCTTAMRDKILTESRLGVFLDGAGDHRLQSKASHFAESMNNQPIEEVLYENIAEALGYKNNRLPFLQITRCLPLHRLREIIPEDITNAEKAKMLEAGFMGISGLLQDLNGINLDAASHKRLAELRNRWEGFPADMRNSPMTTSHWNFAGNRPANHPVRRIAALAGLYGNYLHQGLFRRLLLALQTPAAPGRRRLDTIIRDELTSNLTDIHHEFWARRFNFHSNPAAKPSALVGSQRAKDILTNVFLPTLLGYARNENDDKIEARVFKVWSRLPAGPENRILKRMHSVLFPDDLNPKNTSNSLRRQQGLQQLYNDCCLSDNGCKECILYKAYGAGTAKS